MRNYDRNQPLVALHIPKTAGVSVREVFSRWFGDGLFLHYSGGTSGQMPHRHDLVAAHSPARPVAVYGHFNRRRGFGVEHYYPDARQFVAILRDPFDRMVSSYFYLRRAVELGRPVFDPGPDLHKYVLGSGKGMADSFFPVGLTLENYREVIDTMFVEVGIMEQLDASLQRMAEKLGMPYDRKWLPRLNAAPQANPLPDGLRQEFMDGNMLDYAVYDYVLARYT